MSTRCLVRRTWRYDVASGIEPFRLISEVARTRSWTRHPMARFWHAGGSCADGVDVVRRGSASDDSGFLSRQEPEPEPEPEPEEEESEEEVWARL